MENVFFWLGKGQLRLDFQPFKESGCLSDRNAGARNRINYHLIKVSS